MIRVEPISAFNDNYIWTLINDRNSQCCVVDPGDANAVVDYLRKYSLELSCILITHHHFDHTGGIEQLKDKYACRVFGPHNQKIKGIDRPLREGDNVTIEELDLQFTILEVPGHTLDHIAYLSNDKLFCGDTLFSAGCGRLFEGTAEQMLNSLSKCKSLPTDTKLYPTHEYTSANIQFALAVEPNNQELLDYHAQVTEWRQQNKPTLPTSLRHELNVNPFLRTQNDSVAKAAETFIGHSLSTESDVFAAVRKWKDSF